jgi:signal transduction histidine kinase
MPGVADTLRRLPLFAQLTEEQLASVERGNEIRLRPGDYVKRAGDPPDGFYVVIEGQIEWTSEVRQQEVYVQSLGAGDFWGHELLLTGKPYPVSGRASTEARLYVLETEDFWRMLSACPSILRNLVAILVERWGNLGGAEQRHARLISLGTMAAGLAHELNNPAAAVGRSAQEARGVFRRSSARAVELGALEMGQEERHVLAGLPEEVAARAENAGDLDSLERSDLEDEVATWLEDHGVEEPWDLSPTLVGAGLDAGWLDELEGRLSDSSVGEVVAWLACEVAGDELLREIQHASSRISELVGAVKSYSHMDRLASREVDVHAGLDSTLVMLGHKLKKGDVEVVRDYERDLPHVCGHVGELNQVWTNLLDNAIDAVGGRGRITIRTASENGRILVEVSDDGPGIPEDVKERIFEPFYTTKDVGEGTGLGLDISYRVVVEDHKGDIRVLSEPGDTRFQVRLPVEGPDGVKAVADRDLRMGAGA